MTKYKDKDIIFLILENKFNLHQINLNNYWLEFYPYNIEKFDNITKPSVFPSIKFKILSTVPELYQKNLL